MSTYRFCYLFEVHEEQLDEYQRAHDTIPGDVVTAMVNAGVDDFTLFRRGTLVVATGSSEIEPAELFARLDADEANAAWSTRIRSLMPDPLGADGQLRFADEIWRLPTDSRPACTTASRKDTDD